MSLNEKLKKLRDVLSELDIDVYHYDALNASSEYIVWYESGEYFKRQPFCPLLSSQGSSGPEGETSAGPL